MKSRVTYAKFDPTGLMELSYSCATIGGRNSLETGEQKLLGAFMDENEPWLLVGIVNRDPFFVTQIL